jgi:hypothetical protein
MQNHWLQNGFDLQHLQYAFLDADANDPKGMSVLCRHSFDGNSFVTARSALKCLANVMLLEASTRQIFVDLGYAPKAVERLKVLPLQRQGLAAVAKTEQHDNREDEFLASRLLFLCTYDTNLDFDGLFAHDQLADIINSVGRGSPKPKQISRK